MRCRFFSSVTSLAMGYTRSVRGLNTNYMTWEKNGHNSTGKKTRVAHSLIFSYLTYYEKVEHIMRDNVILSSQEH